MKERLDSWKEIYENSLISENQKMTSIVVTMDNNLSSDGQKKAYGFNQPAKC